MMSDRPPLAGVLHHEIQIMSQSCGEVGALVGLAEDATEDVFLSLQVGFGELGKFGIERLKEIRHHDTLRRLPGLGIFLSAHRLVDLRGAVNESGIELLSPSHHAELGTEQSAGGAVTEFNI